MRLNKTLKMLKSKEDAEIRQRTKTRLLIKLQEGLPRREDRRNASERKR